MSEEERKLYDIRFVWSGEALLFRTDAYLTSGEAWRIQMGLRQLVEWDGGQNSSRILHPEVVHVPSEEIWPSGASAALQDAMRKFEDQLNVDPEDIRRGLSDLSEPDFDDTHLREPSWLDAIEVEEAHFCVSYAILSKSERDYLEEAVALIREETPALASVDVGMVYPYTEEPPPESLDDVADLIREALLTTFNESEIEESFGRLVPDFSRLDGYSDSQIIDYLRRKRGLLVATLSDEEIVDLSHGDDLRRIDRDDDLSSAREWIDNHRSEVEHDMREAAAYHIVGENNDPAPN